MKTRAFLFFVLLAQAGFAQNLVQNGSFEDYTVCPDLGLDYPIGWLSFGSTPDYYNACSTQGAGVPLNAVGYQFASTGVAYMGLYTYTRIPNVFLREYLAYPLLAPLEVGDIYYVSFKVSLSEYYYNTALRCASNNLGIKFTTQAYSDMDLFTLMNNQAHINTSDIITDSTGWVTVRDSFVADSAYSYIVLGNFFDDMHTSSVSFGIDSLAEAYYFLDDVCVSRDAAVCGFFSGVQVHNEMKIFTKYEYPQLWITMDNPPNTHKTSFIIYDLSGKTLKRGFMNDPISAVDCSGLPNGIYILNIRNNQFSYTTKFITN